MQLPGEKSYLAERRAFVATISSLTDDELEGAPTLCAGWAPRDVLGHLLGIDFEVTEYLRQAGRINRANNAIAARYRRLSLDDLRALAARWVDEPAATSRLAAAGLLGDLAIHHQDILRPLGRKRDIPEASRRAILRTGALHGGRRLLSHRVIPLDGGRALGRGVEVRGTSEALGLWLAGRAGLETELEFRV